MAEQIKKVITLNGTSMTGETNNGTMSVYISDDQPMNISINLDIPANVIANMADIRADINTFVAQAMVQAKSVAQDTKTPSRPSGSTAQEATKNDGDNPDK